MIVVLGVIAWVGLCLIGAAVLLAMHLYCDWRAHRHVGFFIERERAREVEDREVAMLEDWLALPSREHHR